MSAPRTLNINGRPVTIQAEGDTPLLWALRHELGLVGTRFGCGIAMCGACTVHVDGEAVRSCSLTVGAVGDKPVTTIEGLSGAVAEALREAWRTVDVAQCGYCQSGQLMSAAALLSVTPQPSDTDIERGMNGNVCRCGTYSRIRAAIRQAADALQQSAAKTE